MIKPEILTAINKIQPGERNLLILKMRMSGMTLQNIGNKFSMTRERVRQICNKTVTQAHEDDLTMLLAELTRLSHHGEHSSLNKRSQRIQVKNMLIGTMSGGFHREAVISILVENSKDELRLDALSNEDICAFIHAEYNIKRYGDYIRCAACQAIKGNMDFAPRILKITNNGRHPPSYCRSCATARHNKQYHSNINVKECSLRYQREHPRRQRVLWLRSHYKGMGKLELMPPIPPRGMPDNEIIVPDLQGGPGSLWNRLSPDQRKEHLKKMNDARIKKRVTMTA